MLPKYFHLTNKIGIFWFQQAEKVNKPESHYKESATKYVNKLFSFFYLRSNFFLYLYKRVALESPLKSANIGFFLNFCFKTAQVERTMCTDICLAML